MGAPSTTSIAGACIAAVACAGAIAVATQAPTGPLAAPRGIERQLTYPEAVRLAKQASFGPSVDLVIHMVQVGPEAWLEEQFAAQPSSYADLAKLVVPRNYCRAMTGVDLSVCNRDYFSSTPVAMRFYADAVTGQDQLRQRVAWAFSQILVASDARVKSTAGLATFQQIFIDNAFGNYRDILKAVTLSPYMGDFLDLADSNRTAPNENYARELMQLFSLGVNQLSADGTLRTDEAGAPIATYTSTDVREVARALTGWTYARIGNAPANDAQAIDYSRPMVKVPARYEYGAKTFLGRTVPAGASQEDSVDAVVDAVFNHANLAPFISSRLIQHLVTSNPSPQYVERAAKVFADNGQGVRGDLKAVVRAILLDPEARQPTDPARAGKVKDPVLLETGLARVIGMQSDGYAFTTRDYGMGQQVFRAPSVFNFYPPDYPLPLGGDLVSPQSKLMTTASAIARHNLAYDWTIGGDPSSRSEFKPLDTLQGATGTEPRWIDWEGLSLDDQIDRIDLLMLERTLTPAQLAAMRKAMLAVTNPDAAVQARRRAQVGLYIAASSPLFQVDR